MELSVSILNSKDRVSTIKMLNNSNITYIHLDVMDGKFVSQTSLPIDELRELIKVSQKRVDIHLMVENPIAYIKELEKYNNIEYVTVHLEIEKDIESILKEIKDRGFKVGLSIKPNTDINRVVPYLKYLDLILLMTVEPGLGGQAFLTSSIERLKKLKSIINKNIKIEVDGGINNITIKDVKDADIAVVGSYITLSDDPINKINSLLV